MGRKASAFEKALAAARELSADERGCLLSLLKPPPPAKVGARKLRKAPKNEARPLGTRKRGRPAGTKNKTKSEAELNTSDPGSVQ